MTLFIDTHMEYVYICLYENEKIVKEKKIEASTQTSKIVMPIIKKMISKDDVTNILVVNGPGSFTGVRIGVTIAKGFAQNLNVPVRTITSLECIASSLDESEKIVAFSDNNGYYIGIFDEEMKLVGNYEYLDNHQFEAFSKKYNVISNINYIPEKAIKYGLSKEEINYHEVNPIYVKKIDVEK